MKNISVDQKEAKRILLMHKFLIAEQSNSTQDTGEGVIDNLISVGCLKGGEKIRSKKTGKVFYRKKLGSGNTLRQFSDMTFTVTDLNGKIIKTAKFNCDSYVNTSQNNSTQIELLKKQYSWKERKEIEPITDEELSALYQKHPNFDLYKLKDESGKTGEFNNQQQAFINKANDLGYKEMLTDDEIASGKYKKYLVPGSEKYFPGGLTMYYAASTVKSSGADIKSTFKQTVKDQTPESKNECKDTIKDYFNAWRNKSDVPTLELEAMRRQAQVCINNFNFRGGIFSETDDYVEIMTGARAGKGIGPGPNEILPGTDPKEKILWRLTPRRTIK